MSTRKFHLSCLWFMKPFCWFRPIWTCPAFRCPDVTGAAARSHRRLSGFQSASDGEENVRGSHLCGRSSAAFCAGLQSPSFSVGLQQGGRVCVRALHGDGECGATALQQNRREKHEIRTSTQIRSDRYKRKRRAWKHPYLAVLWASPLQNIPTTTGCLFFYG